MIKRDYESDQIEFLGIMNKYIKENDCGFSEAYEYACKEIDKQKIKVSKKIENVI